VEVTLVKNSYSDIELAEHVGVSAGTLRVWRRRRVGPKFVRVGRSVRYLSRDVEEYLTRRTVETTDDSREETTA
jgi:predicted DNA-binding transcriptional regulator AlpA